MDVFPPDVTGLLDVPMGGIGGGAAGGAIHVTGPAELTDSSFSANTATGGPPGDDDSHWSVGGPGRGGAVAQADGATGTVTITDTTASANVAAFGGWGSGLLAAAGSRAVGGAFDLGGPVAVTRGTSPTTGRPETRHAAAPSTARPRSS